MKCEHCGASNLDGAERCSACGEGLGGTPAGTGERASDGSRSTWIIAGIAALVFVGLLFSSSLGPSAGGGAVAPEIGFTAVPDVARIGSDSAIGTAIDLSREGWPGGASAAVLYSVEDSAAAAVAAPLATALDAPILLGSTGALESEVVARLAEMGVARVTVLDSGSFTTGFDTALAGSGIEVTRIGGDGAAKLSGAVARATGAVKPINGYLLVSRGGEQRAVLAGAYAGANVLPVLIVEGSSLAEHAELFRETRMRSLVVCVPEAVLPDSMFAGQEFDSALLDRIDAPDDPTFARLFAEYAYAHGFEYQTVFAVQASHVRHAFAAAPIAARSGSSMILVEDAALGDAATQFFIAHASAISTVRFVGPADPSVDALLADARKASETLISADAYPLDDATAALVSGVTSDTVTFVAEPGLETTLTAGKIIVSGIAPNAPEGFLRRIVSVSEQNGSLVVQTEQASLSEVIIKGSFDVRVSGDTSATQSLSSYPAPVGEVLEAVAVPGRMDTAGAGRLSLQQVKAGRFDHETDHIEIPVDWPKLEVESGSFDLPDDDGGGEGKFSASVDAYEEWETWYVINASWQRDFLGLPSVQEFGIVAYLRHTYELDYEVRFERSGSVMAEGRSALPSCIAQKIGGRDEGKEIQFTSTFSIGPVPVVLVSYIAPYIGFDGTVKGTLEGRYEKTIEAWVGAKVRFDSGQVIPVMGLTDRSPAVHPPTAGGELETKVAVGLKIGTRLYGVAGPYMRGELFFKGAFQDPTPPGEYPMFLQLGFEGTVGGDLKVVFKGVTILDGASIELSPWEKIFWEWPDGPPPTAPAPPAPPAPSAPPSAPTPPGAPGSSDVATVIVIDSSGSMQDPSGNTTKIGAAQDAAHVLLDLLEGYLGSIGEVGVVTFSDDADLLVPSTGDAAAVRSAIDGLGAYGMTNIYAGLRSGVDELSGAAAKDRVLFFLSDGLDTVGNDTDEIVDVAKEAGDQGIDIITIGFGDAQSIDEGLLKRIADATPRGEYSLVDPNVAVGLIGRFASAQVARSGATVLYETMGAVSEGETVPAGSTSVPAEYGNLEVTLAWPGSDMDVVLTDPSGAAVAEGYPGYSVVKTERTAQVKVQGAKPGDWGFEVVGIETSMDEEPFYLLAAHRETTGTPVPAGGGAATNDGSGLLLALVALLGVGAVSWVVVSGKARSKDGAQAARPEDGAQAARPGDAGSGSQPAVEPPASTRRPSGYALVDSGGVTHPLITGANTLGRAADNDVVLSDATVSRHHAMIVIGADGARVKDLGSTQGTVLDGSRVDGSSKAHAGSVIAVGDVKLTVVKE